MLHFLLHLVCWSLVARVFLILCSVHSHPHPHPHLSIPLPVSPLQVSESDSASISTLPRFSVLTSTPGAQPLGSSVLLPRSVSGFSMRTSVGRKPVSDESVELVRSGTRASRRGMSVCGGVVEKGAWMFRKGDPTCHHHIYVFVCVIAEVRKQFGHSRTAYVYSTTTQSCYPHYC